MVAVTLLLLMMGDLTTQINPYLTRKQLHHMPALSRASEALNRYIEKSGAGSLSEDQLRGFLRREKIYAYQVKPLTVSRKDPTAFGETQIFLRKNAPLYNSVGYHQSEAYSTVLMIKQPLSVAYQITGRSGRKMIRIRGDVHLRRFSHLFLYIREPDFNIKQILVPIIDNKINIRYPLRQQGRYIFELLDRRNDDPVILAKFPVISGNGEQEEHCSFNDVNGLIREINRIRYLNGGKKLRFSPALSRVAELHSYEMAHKNYFSHNSPRHGSPTRRVKAGEIPFLKLLENISKARNLCKAHREILESPGHLKNLLDREVDTIGIGVVERNGVTYLTENMIKSVKKKGINPR